MRTKPSKGSKRPRRNSKATPDKRKPDAMAMNRKVTRDIYAAREVEQSAPSKADRVRENKAGLDAVQSTMKPIRSGQS